MNGAREVSPGDEKAAHQRIRRSGRIVRRIAIILFGHDEEGHTFAERTHAVMLSLHGAGILSTQRFVPEQELILRVEETNREAVVRVVGKIATDRELHTYGVAFLNETLDFWQVEFPPPASDAQPMMLTLECGSCGQRLEVVSGQFEYDICQIHGGLTRQCADCGVLTVWRRTDGIGPSLDDRARREDKPSATRVEPDNDILGNERRFASPEISPRSGEVGLFFQHRERAADASKSGWRDRVSGEGKIADTGAGVPRAKKSFSGLAQGDGREVPKRIVPPPVEEEEPAIATRSDQVRDPNVERRQRTRAKVNFFAAVKTPHFGLDIVTCLDMSKGGVGFRSRNPYKKEMKIQIAVPYAPEAKNAPAIFVSGRIANVRKIDGIQRCGAEFLKEP